MVYNRQEETRPEGDYINYEAVQIKRQERKSKQVLRTTWDINHKDRERNKSCHADLDSISIKEGRLVDNMTQIKNVPFKPLRLQT